MLPIYLTVVHAAEDQTDTEWYLLGGKRFYIAVCQNKPKEHLFNFDFENKTEILILEGVRSRAARLNRRLPQARQPRSS
jgi:hypothetical protein